MKLKITFIALCISSLAFGQNSEYNFHSDWNFNNLISKPLEYNYTIVNKKNDVDQIHYIVTNKKGKKTSHFKEFNKNGDLTKYYLINDRQKKIPIIEIEYDEQKEINIKVFKNGKLDYVTEKKWKNKNTLSECTKTDKKGKVISNYIWEYNSDGCLVTSTYSEKQKVKKRWEYEYYQKCDKSFSRLYNGKDKLLNVWTHHCSQDVEKLTKKSDTTQICKWDESSDGFLFSVYQSFDEKGDVIKSIRKFTKSDTLIVEFCMYDKNDNLIHRTTYDKHFMRPLKREGFSKGKSTYAYEYQYIDGNIASYTNHHKGKHIVKYENKYENERLVEQVKYDKNGTITSHVKIEYGKPLETSKLNN